MILLEQNIELKIYHLKKLRRYDVVETLEDDEGMSFKIFYEKEYIFTLIPVMHEYLMFELAALNRRFPMDWKLYLKIEASLYSIFLKGPSS